MSDDLKNMPDKNFFLVFDLRVIRKIIEVFQQQVGLCHDQILSKTVLKITTLVNNFIVFNMVPIENI